MPDLLPFAVDRSDVTPYYEALAATLAGTGPALAPYPAGTSAPEVPQHPQGAPDDLALVVSTSGSTGIPKRAMLTRAALIASARATHERIGGGGTWLLPLPPEHIAGTQVLVRSIAAGTTPIVMDSWSVDRFVKATTLVTRNAPPFTPIHTSLVPTQLRDVLGQDAGIAAARRYRSILVGGASTPPDLLTAARSAGLPIVTTYGSSETSGGCVYDGRPLDGVEVTLLDETAGRGRIALTGPMLASGYLDAPELSSRHFRTIDGTPAYVTDDLGHLSDGRLVIEGRVDDVITTGGYKVAPHIVEEVVRRLGAVRDVLCVGTPDERWGQTVSVAIVTATGALPNDSAENALDIAVLDVCRRHLPPYAVPRRIATFERLPTRGIGKPDRAALTASDHWRDLRSAG